ncbi:MAG: hypothetical protein J5817_01030 [Treponema sp.]|nr:hypothetical protein [Treponema sp.]
MDFEAVILSFYLLFPQVHPWQGRLDAAFDKDGLALNVKQDVRKEIIGVLNSYNNALVPSDASIPVDDSILDTLGTVAVLYKNSSGKLRLFEYGDEQLALTPSVNGGRGIVSVNGEYVTRTLYDSAFRKTERISWKQGGSLPFIANRKTYVYRDPLPKGGFLKKYSAAGGASGGKAGGSASAVLAKALDQYSRTPVSLWDEDFENKKIQDVKFDSRGNPVRIDFYDVVKDEETNKESNLLVKTRVSSFDGSNRLVSEEERLFFKKMDPLRFTMTKDAFLTRKNVYTYKSYTDIPDCNFYEDGILRMSTVYSKNENYTETVYFDGGLSIKSVYKDGVKVEEIAYSNGDEKYRRKFNDR